MSGLFKKLNTLVRASIHDALGDISPDASKRPVDPIRLGKDLEREVESLRGRIDEAIEYEETLRTKVTAMHDEIAQLDQRADEAVERGDEAQARYLIEQMQRIQRRAEMAEADLREHQIVTEEFIQRVNLLDTVVADARRQQAEDASASQVSTPEPDETASHSGPVQALSDMLRDARERINKADDAVADETAKAQSQLEADEKPSGDDEKSVDDDLAARLKRLSKPD